MAPTNPGIHALDFDANRRRRRRSSDSSQPRPGDDDFDFMGQVTEEIIERDRARMRREVKRVLSFASAVLSCLCAGSITSFSLYGARFLQDLHYTQSRVNVVSVSAELGLYLVVPIFGYFCDRYSPPPLSLLSSLLFGTGYLLAAYTYKSGPPPDAASHPGNGWPFGVMVVAFVLIGAGTCAMYLSAVATCAKNFANAKYRGFMLAVPIASFGLSGMWESQVGAHLLYEKLPNGHKGEVDVFKYFVFLAGTLIGVGLLGTLGLQIVDEEELIDHGVENLERSGLLDESEFYRDTSRGPTPVNYGTIGSDEESGDGSGNVSDDDLDSEADRLLSESQLLKKDEETRRLRRKKYWLLNHATHAFLTDRTMWLLAAGFFLVTGPGEAYINNLGTIIPTLTPQDYNFVDGSGNIIAPPAGQASTHVSIIALASTFGRLFTGTLSDLFAPPSNPDIPPSARFHFSRLSLLLPSAFLQLLCFLNLGLRPLVSQHPSLFLLSSALLGLGYGACFSLVPIIISVVWGVENFATNWGVVAMSPAGGAAVWSFVYSAAYSGASNKQKNSGEGECHGYMCFGAWAWGCAMSVTLAIFCWCVAWKVWRGRRVVV
ncbi:putative monocarboxylate transporter mch1 [Cladophialophora chaetospira]|uniref:Probable transporter MCH1 n=1 Tax=Cladophialophora chaetospira TaxID=386627 RepID=A0AA38X087_9EURO|nr:putative monocarboxylate transporter mch1 [Cladophialophora chaetospira]